MSSPPDPRTFEGLLDEYWPGATARPDVMALVEPYREHVTHLLDDFDDDEQSWRDYCGCIFGGYNPKDDGAIPRAVQAEIERMLREPAPPIEPCSPGDDLRALTSDRARAEAPPMETDRAVRRLRDMLDDAEHGRNDLNSLETGAIRAVLDALTKSRVYVPTTPAAREMAMRSPLLHGCAARGHMTEEQVIGEMFMHTEALVRVAQQNAERSASPMAIVVARAPAVDPAHLSDRQRGDAESYLAEHADEDRVAMTLRLRVDVARLRREALLLEGRAAAIEALTR